MNERKNEEMLRWVNDCRKGNRRAQYKMFKHFYSPMFRLCMRYANTTDEAQDMLSEGFLKVFSNLDKYENTGSFESWMSRVMVNAALDHRRKYDRIQTYEALDDVQDLMDVGCDVNAAITKMNAEDLVALIQLLPPTTRTVFNLYVFDGFSHAEIAQQLNISEGTSAWHVNAARTRLKNEIIKRNNKI